MKSKYKKYIKLFIPKVVFDHLHYKLMLVSPEFEYDINIFYSILNDLCHIKYYNDYESSNEMLPMYSKLLQKKYGNQYNKYIQYLNVNSIIYGTGYYKPNSCYHYAVVVNDSLSDMLDSTNYYCTTYCLNIYNTNTIEIIDIHKVIRASKKVRNLDIVIVKVLTTSKVGKYIITEHNKELDRNKHSKPHVRVMEKHYKKNIAINYDDAMSYVVNQYASNIIDAGDDINLKDKAYNGYQHRIRTIIEISEGGKYLRFGRNRTNRRIDTNLTNMASELRQFLTGFENMSYLDLSNSQPVLFNIMLNGYSDKNNPSLEAEIMQYRSVTLSGMWYEKLMEIYGITERKKAKELWMLIAYSKNTTQKRLKKKFANVFPEIYKIIESQKQTNHASFSIELQKIESNIFIDEICKELVSVHVIPYTLHDGIIVRKDKEELTYSIMANILKKYLGKIPVISINEVKRFPEID